MILSLRPFALAALLLVPAAVLAHMPSAAPTQAPGMPGAPAGQMPDARMMSGIPMPMADVPDGTVSVRVVRGELANTMPDQVVELTVGGKTHTARTDASGRVQFTGLAAGATLKASATVNGEHLESQEFTLPGKGGVRLLLVASGAGGGAQGQPDAAMVAGTVTFGTDSRVAIEFEDDALTVYYVLDILNNASVPVNPMVPLVFDLPADAGSATLLEGSSSQARVKGAHVTVVGPFKPGRTPVQLAYQLTPAGSTRLLEQTFPVAFDAVSVSVQKAGNLQISSPQIAEQQVVPIDGKAFIMASGPALAAGRPLAIELSGLPHHETWPRTVALVVAIGVLLAGAWAAIGAHRAGVDPRRVRLASERERLFAQLVKVESARRAGIIDEQACAERHAALMGELERIYGELDSAAAPLPAVAGAGRGTTA